MYTSGTLYYRKKNRFPGHQLTCDPKEKDERARTSATEYLNTILCSKVETVTTTILKYRLVKARVAHYTCRGTRAATYFG